MKNWKVEVFYKSDVPDTIGLGIVEDIFDLGIQGVESVRTAAVYWIEGDLDSQTVDRIGSELLADPITQNYTFDSVYDNSSDWTVEVQFKPGVTDAVGDSTAKGIKDIGISRVDAVRTGQKFWLHGDLNSEMIQTIAQRLLMNDVIQSYSYQEPQHL